MESGVKDSHVRQVWERFSRLIDSAESRCVVKRGESFELVDLANLLVD